MFDKKLIRRYLNKAAQTYAQADVLHREIADRLMARLPFIRMKPQRVLECGARTGYLSTQLRQYYPDAALIALEYADRQLACIQDSSIVKIASYYETLPIANDSVDLVISSLGWNEINDFSACFRECKRVLKPDGLLMFTLLGVETLKELRQSFASCQEYLYQFPDMHDVGDLLLQSGFEDPVMDMETITFRYKHLNTLFQDIKWTGSTNAHQKRSRGLFGKAQWQQALENYECLKKDDAYPATFEIIYAHAWQPEEALDATVNEICIPIESIDR